MSSINIQVEVSADQYTAFNSCPKVARRLQETLQAAASTYLTQIYADLGKSEEQLAEERRIILADAEKGAY